MPSDRLTFEPNVTLPEREHIVIRNAFVLSIDTEIGDLEYADVHVRDGLIFAVGVGLDAGDATEIDGSGMIVMPGFVDAHWHLWSTLFRNLLRTDRGYFDLLFGLAPHFSAEDFNRSVRLALAEATNAGITTVLNFSHNTRTPAHADAEIAAHIECGLRGRYSYGHISGMPSTEVMPLDDLPRVQRDWFGANGPAGDRLSLGYSWRGPLLTPPEVYRPEFEAARNLGLPVTTHAGQGPPYKVDAVQMRKDGFLGPDMLLVHFLEARAEDRQALAETGTSLSISMQSEQHFGAQCDLRSHLLHCLDDGVNLCLSVDATSAASVNPFENMSFAWYTGIPWPDTPTANIPAVSFRQCLEMATINSAKAMGLDDQIGSLTPGKRADLIMIRATDINMAPLGEADGTVVRSATPANVDTVVADGRILKRGGKLLAVDTEKVVADAGASLHAVLTRASGAFAPSSVTPRRS
jgi:5-methylthioadenosine/S-adenosylhomocysteine deaminase